MKVFAGDDFLAAARFPFDQDREGVVGVLGELEAELLDRRTVADDAFARDAGHWIKQQGSL